MVEDNSSTGSNRGTTVVSVSKQRPDVRNLEWKKANVGSKLLSKMGGWQEGQAIGKRQRQRDEVSDGQGLRVTKRPDGWGLGHAVSTASSSATASTAPHVHDFTNVLASLRQHHQPLQNHAQNDDDDDDDGNNTNEKVESSTITNSADHQRRPRKKKRLSAEEPRPKKRKTSKSSKTNGTAILPRNRMTHAKVRAAKFQTKTDQDWIGIFGTATSLSEPGV
jgi:hypothetical protein